MLWAYYKPCITWEDDVNKKVSWTSAYVFNREEERDVSSSSFEIDVSTFDYHDFDENLEDDIKFRDEMVKEIKEKGYYVWKDQMEIVVPEQFDEEEFKNWIKTGIREFFNDDMPDLSPGEYYEFAGTNSDSIGIMIVKDMIKKLGLDKVETEEDMDKWRKEHPEVREVNLDDLEEGE